MNTKDIRANVESCPNCGVETINLRFVNRGQQKRLIIDPQKCRLHGGKGWLNCRAKPKYSQTVHEIRDSLSGVDLPMAQALFNRTDPRLPETERALAAIKLHGQEKP